MITYFITLLAGICLVLTKDAPTVPTQPFRPKPIRITLDDIPPPYKTTSAKKPAIVVGVPSNATLLVPDTNFRVTIYRDGMKAPRKMVYTPSGDILVTEMHGNRISILTDDGTSIFADASNEISQAFGMAFVEVSLILILLLMFSSIKSIYGSRDGFMLPMLENFDDTPTKLAIEN